MPIQGFHKKSVAERQSLSDRLKQARHKKGLSIEDAERDTCMRLHYLQAMEDNRFHELPPAQAKGFIRRYGEYLDLEKDLIRDEIERIALDLQKRQPFSPRMLERETKWLITPRALASVFSVIVLLLFIGYVTYQVRQFSAPPLLTITQPQNESVVTEEALTVDGQTDPGATVSIDNLQVSVNASGTFSYALTLRPGLNQVTIRAENRIKKGNQQILSILYKAPAATPAPVPTESSPPAPQ